MGDVKVQEEIHISPEVDYDEVGCIYGKYEHIQVTCQEALTQVVPTSGTTLTFQIVGQNVCNLAKSYLEFDLCVDAQAATFYTWLMAGSIPFFRSVAFQPTSGQQLYTDQYHHFSKMSLPYLMTEDQLKSYDPSNIFTASRVIPSQNKLPANGYNAAVPYDEMAYAINISGTNNTNVTYHVSIPFELFAGTILAENRDHCFGQAVNIQFTMEDKDKWLWKGTDPVDPSTGATALTVVTNFKMQNIYLQLAVEQDEALVRRTKDMALSGYRCKVSSVQKLYQQSISGTSQNINAPVLNRGYGEKLKRIYVAPFAGTENLNTSLNNCNQTAFPVVDATTNRVITFQTLLDSRPLQQKYITASPNVQQYAATSAAAASGGIGDFNRYKDYLAGSCILTAGVLGLNFCHVDDFTERDSRLQKYAANQNRECGMDLSFGEHTWQWLSTNATGTYNWYVYVETVRVMEISPGAVRIY